VGYRTEEKKKKRKGKNENIIKENRSIDSFGSDYKSLSGQVCGYGLAALSRLEQCMYLKSLLNGMFGKTPLASVNFILD
jgi:hypothetical protein